MRARTLLLSACLLAVVCAGAMSQPQPGLPPLPTPNLPSPSAAPAPPAPVVQPRLEFFPSPPSATPSVVLPSVPTPPPPPPEKTVDDLIKELEGIQAQKAELEKKEKELKAALGKKLEVQGERLKKLGVTPQVRPFPPHTTAVGGGFFF